MQSAQQQKTGVVGTFESSHMGRLQQGSRDARQTKACE